MKHTGTAEELRDFFMTRGMVHLGYRAGSMADLISPYSVEGYELPCGELLGYVDRMLPLLPEDRPVLLEISGGNFTEKEREAVGRTLRTQYLLRAADRQKQLRRCLIKSAWFLLSLIVSSVLLFCSDGADRVLTQYAYLPFWFFGYRFLTYLILDCLPLAKESRRCVMLSAMEVFFTSTPAKDISETDAQTYRDHIAQRLGLPANPDHQYDFGRAYSRLRVDYRKTVGGYFMEGKTAALACTGNSASDFLRASNFEGYELPDDAFTAYLEDSVPYIPQGSPVELEIRCDSLTESGKDAVLRALRMHFRLGLLDAENGVRRSLCRIVSFALGLLAATILLFFADRADKAVAECITMTFWFFGDYLAEYILLGHREALAKRRQREQLCGMKVEFKGTEE